MFATAAPTPSTASLRSGLLSRGRHGLGRTTSLRAILNRDFHVLCRHSTVHTLGRARSCSHTHTRGLWRTDILWTDRRTPTYSTRRWLRTGCVSQI